ncbi:MAG TPA: tRNA (adenosine(37)-N6)-threonylcarbamoyltransferase complex dimerization subunit type 1 TsaB [Dehalococcoidales bacterium]|nr:tRNA (adenosine(37)-N6)-threonylcarbamoyltransferase complex dimerization subunit type 1 TsaB [Dehalococcoidales bacterium]
MQLAIDTATDTASLVLIQNGEVLAESTWRCEQSHTTQLLPHLVDLMEQNKLSLQSISGVIVVKGPGSYNGLRVGISTAKGLAFSLGIPIIGISSLELAAYQHADTGLPIRPILNAGRGEIATALYQKKDSEWSQLTPEHITTVDQLLPQITTKTVFCGEFVSSIATELRNQFKEKAVIPPPPTPAQRASLFAKLGRMRLEAGSYDDPVTLQPLYLRRPQITKSKRYGIGA